MWEPYSDIPSDCTAWEGVERMRVPLTPAGGPDERLRLQKATGLIQASKTNPPT
jgi:hypothetical protein